MNKGELNLAYLRGALSNIGEVRLDKLDDCIALSTIQFDIQLLLKELESKDDEDTTDCVGNAHCGNGMCGDCS